MILILGQCERQPGSCGNCRRANRPCFGYRDEIYLGFCDPTGEVLQRYGQAPPSSATAVPTWASSKVPTPSAILAPSAKEVSLAHFHNHHITLSPNVLITNVIFLDSMKALGAASYANTTRTKSFEMEDTKQYPYHSLGLCPLPCVAFMQQFQGTKSGLPKRLSLVITVIASTTDKKRWISQHLQKLCQFQ